MTKQGERPSRRYRGRSRRRIIALCTVGGVAIAVGVVVAESGDWLPGAGRTTKEALSSVPADAAPPTQPLTEEQFFTVERYFPAKQVIDNGGYKARRTAARQGPACAEALADKARDVLKDTNCLSYVSVSFTQDGNQVVSSVTVLRFADDAAAEQAEKALVPNAEAIAFLPPDPGALPTPSGTPQPAGGRQQTSTQVDAVGHYLTVTTSRFTDPAAAGPAGALDDATRAVGYTARAPFIWL
ncbi:hypothetical protein ACIRBX_03630 [Kitasatospora sp. NPDC096147]|uniref:hypothetical protein n=1 Tax=Kitasatospora sp. NPDC096147 TaxID=3364093 RepID=UPI0037FB6DA7